jgi:hypothetical protein
MIVDLPRHLGRFAELLGSFARQAVALHTWGAFWIAFLAALAVLAFRRQWRTAALATVVITPMVLLYAGVVAVTNWDISIMDDLAPRLQTHLLGPALYAIAAASKALKDL